MKKVLFIVGLALLGFSNVNAQETSFGVTAGFHDFKISVSGGELTASDNASGFYAGFFAEFNVAEKFNIQPEIHYASVFKDGETTNEIVIPVMAKYYISDGFNVQAGPQFDYVLDNDAEGINKLGLGLGLGVGYDFTDKVFAASRYSIGLSNRIEDAPSGISSKFNTFQIGLGYRF